MPVLRSLIILVVFVIPPSLFSQQLQVKHEQTARQALIEILSGTGDSTKHLTVEIQKDIKSNAKNQLRITPVVMMGAFRSAVEGSQVKTFETGPVLLSSSVVKDHIRTEIHVDNDELNGLEATLQLSVHQFLDDKEVDTPFQFISQITVGLKKQENIWRLNEIGVSANFPVGDPAMFRKLNAEAPGDTSIVAGSASLSANEQERPKADIQTILSLLAVQERMFASLHPEQGFTCTLAELLADTDRMERFGLDPQVKSGFANGFRINLIGCQGIPSGSYQITAEPISPSAGSKAFCTDATFNVRQSDDGRGSTCLTSGRVPARNPAPEEHAEHVVDQDR